MSDDRRFEIIGGPPKNFVQIIRASNQPDFIADQKIIEGYFGAIGVFENGTELK